jgi:hypothetical protein
MSKDLLPHEKLLEAEAYIKRQQETIERYEDALTKIATRKMSMYIDKDHMLRNFIYLADNALNGEEG